MVTAPEDPIEAIKRRNEERAQKLKEKIASGEFFGFGEAIDEIAETPPETVQETTSDFDLSSFPPPPDTGTIPIGEEETVDDPSPDITIEEPPVPEGLDIEITPLPTEIAPTMAETEEPAGGLEIELTPQEEQPSDIEIPLEEMDPIAVEAPPPPPEEMIAASVSATDDSTVSTEQPSVEITGISFDGDDFEDFPVPDTWSGEDISAIEPEPTPEVVVVEPELEITAVEPEPEITAIEPEPEITAVEPTPEITIVEPELEITAVEPTPDITAVEPEPVIAVVEPEPEITAAEPAPEIVVAESEPTPEVAVVEPQIVPEVELDQHQLIIDIGIEVQGNNVRVRRENIDMDGTIELFKKIIEKYEGN